jgi:hypothetical protein
LRDVAFSLGLHCIFRLRLRDNEGVERNDTSAIRENQ